MAKNLSITEARYRLMDLPEQFEDKAEAVTVTRRGKPVLAVLPWDFYETIMETMEIMGDEKLMSALNESLNDIKNNNLIPWEKVKKNLKL